GLQQGGQQVQARLAAQAQVHKGQVDGLLQQHLQRLGTRRRLQHAVLHALQRQANGPPQTDLVVNDQQIHGVWFLCSQTAAPWHFATSPLHYTRRGRGLFGRKRVRNFRRRRLC